MPITGPDSQNVDTLDTGKEDHLGSQATGDESSAGHSESLTTDADCFGVYRVYARKPTQDPSQSSGPNTPRDVQSNPDADRCPGTVPAQGPLHLDAETTPYYRPFSNPSAAAMMVSHHLGGHMQS